MEVVGTVGGSAAASFVLLVTVLPEVASGEGLGSPGARLSNSASCSGSSGSSSGFGSSSGCCSDSGSSGSSSASQCSTGTATITGTGTASASGTGTIAGSVAVTGAPNGFVPAYIGMGACPSSEPPVQLCTDPDYTLAEDGTYSLSLTAGTWEVAAFYESDPLGGVFLGTFETGHRPLRRFGERGPHRGLPEAVHPQGTGAGDRRPQRPVRAGALGPRCALPMPPTTAWTSPSPV